MKEPRLDEDLKVLARRPRPSLPADFNGTVWSKIQGRQTEAGLRFAAWLEALRSALRTPQAVAAVFAIALLAGWVLGRITANPSPVATETRLAGTVTGEVIDIACYFADGSSGPEHAACARACISSGLPVGLKAKDGTVYVLIGRQEPPSPEPAAKHESLNAQLAPLAAKIVTISGTIVRRDGVNVIEDAEVGTQEALGEQSPDRMADLKADSEQFL
jgi:hypothetical protein